MKVKELIKKLEKMNQNAYVAISEFKGYSLYFPEVIDCEKDKMSKQDILDEDGELDFLPDDDFDVVVIGV